MGNYYLYIIAQFAARLLPLKAAYAMAIFMADCHYMLSHSDRRAVEANLKVILKTDQIDPAMVRQVFRNFGKYLADFFTMTKHVNSDFIKTKVRMENMEYLNKVLTEGKGAIILGAHVGNWEMGGAIVSKLGYPISALALPHKDPRVNKFFNDQREYFGAVVIQTTTAIRQCLEHLHNNRLVGILADRDFNNHGLIMDFLGRPTALPRGAALFSLKTGAPIIPAFFLRQPNDDFYIIFEPPIYPPQLPGHEKITEEHVKDLIRQYLPVLEEQIRQHPQQWLMFRKFWAQ